ncbi:MAG: F0F1 ATP synthase subunit B [Defluviitaleaceae bacterium]|nr:F0F1 ATP synthase subunit B [Defluviitaleaceae bacterium]
MDINIEIMPDWTQLLIQLLSLCILLFAFKRFAWEPTKAFLAKRQAFLNSGFEEAKTMKTEALNLKEKYETQIEQAEVEAEKIVEASKADGKTAYDEMVTAARAEAEQELAKAALAIEQDRKMAHTKIKEEIASMTISGAKQIIKKEIDAKVHQQLFDDFIAKVGHENG